MKLLSKSGLASSIAAAGFLYSAVKGPDFLVDNGPVIGSLQHITAGYVTGLFFLVAEEIGCHLASTVTSGRLVRPIGALAGLSTILLNSHLQISLDNPMHFGNIAAYKLNTHCSKYLPPKVMDYLRHPSLKLGKVTYPNGRPKYSLS